MSAVHLGRAFARLGGAPPPPPLAQDAPINDTGVPALGVFVLLAAVLIVATAVFAVFRNRNDDEEYLLAGPDAEVLHKQQMMMQQQQQHQKGWQQAGMTKLEQWVDRAKTNQKRLSRSSLRRVVVSRPRSNLSANRRRSQISTPIVPPVPHDVGEEDLGTTGRQMATQQRPNHPSAPYQQQASYSVHQQHQQQPPYDLEARPMSAMSDVEAVRRVPASPTSVIMEGGAERVERVARRITQHLTDTRRVSVNTKLRQLERSKELFRAPPSSPRSPRPKLQFTEEEAAAAAGPR